MQLRIALRSGVRVRRYRFPIAVWEKRFGETRFIEAIFLVVWLVSIRAFEREDSFALF